MNWSAYHKAYREVRKKKGLCVRCGQKKPKDRKDKTTCKDCLNRQTNWEWEKRRKNGKVVRKYNGRKARTLQVCKPLPAGPIKLTPYAERLIRAVETNPTRTIRNCL